MLLSRVLLSGGLAVGLGSALVACDSSSEAFNADAAVPSDATVPVDATEDPVLSCTPSECGPRPIPSTFLCPDGTLGGYGACKRGPDDVCGYLYYACGQMDGGAPEGGSDGAAVDATADADTDDGGKPEPELDAGELPPRCGTADTALCEHGEFCSYSVADQCGRASSGGTCVVAPSACADSVMPVCGCDGRSYSNVCSANQLGVSVRHRGLCSSAECSQAGGRPKPVDADAGGASCERGEERWDLEANAVCCLPPIAGGSCGGIVSPVCALGEWCNREEPETGEGCGSGVGACVRSKQACSLTEYEPVCGCDYRTYPTRCLAHAAQMGVLHRGVCNDQDCEAAGGRAVRSTGAAPKCGADEVSHGVIRFTSGLPSIEGAICCVKLQPVTLP